MIDTLTASDIANEMSMLRSAFKGTFLVVEGASDCRLYTKFVNTDKVRIMVAHSKNNVLNSVNTLVNRRKDRKVLGIADKDMDGMLGRKRLPPIFLTDRRDMESSILSTPALSDVLSEYADQERLADFVKRYGPMSESLAKAANPLGLLMFVSYKNGMNLSFKELDFSLFVNPRTLETDIVKMVATVYANSMDQRFPRAAIADQVRSLMEQWKSSWEVTRGHDAVTILRIGLRNAFGSYNARGINDNELGGAIRLAYSREYFESSQLYKDTKTWAENNNLELWYTENEQVH